MTTIYRTEQASVLWQKEASFGTRPSTATEWEQFGIHDTFEAPDPEIAYEPMWQVGSSRNRSKLLRGKWTMKGRVSDVRVNPDTALKVLALPIGRVDNLSVVEGRATNDERLDSISIQVAVKDTSGSYFIREWYGGKINRASLDFSEGEDLRVSLDDITFKDMVQNQSDIDKYLSVTTPFSPKTTLTGNRYVFAAGQMVFFGQTLGRIKSASLSVENNLEEKYYWTYNASNTASQTLTDLIEGRRTYNLTVEMDFADPTTDMTMFKWLMNQSAANGAKGSSSPTVGGQIVLSLYPIGGESVGQNYGSGKLTITAGINPSSNQPGAVVTNGKISIPSLSSSGLLASNWTIDVNSISITQGS